MALLIRNFLFLSISAAIIFGCSSKADPSSDKEEESYKEETKISQASDDSLLTLVQRHTFNYFWEGGEPNSGLAPERLHMDEVYPTTAPNIVTTGGSGMGMMAILVGVERGFISREQAFKRFDKIATFLENCDRFHGAWPHWLNGETGKTYPFSKKDNGGDLVETSFLAEGFISIREYFKNGSDDEKALAARYDSLWKGIEFDWYTRDENVLYWHWSPEFEWEMDFPVGGYNECLIMYVLAAASPTHGVDKKVYQEGWARSGAIKTDRKYYDLDLVLDHYEGNDDPVGPLFWAHYSYLGLNPSKLSDQYGDYWKLNKNHALTHYRYCVENPENYEGYGENCWGLTSSYSIKGYKGHRPGNDLGVITPTAALSSFPYTPDESMKFLRFLYEPSRDSLIGKYLTV